MIAIHQSPDWFAPWESEDPYINTQAGTNLHTIFITIAPQIGLIFLSCQYPVITQRNPKLDIKPTWGQVGLRLTHFQRVRATWNSFHWMEDLTVITGVGFYVPLCFTSPATDLGKNIVSPTDMGFGDVFNHQSPTGHMNPSPWNFDGHLGMFPKSNSHLLKWCPGSYSTCLITRVHSAMENMSHIFHSYGKWPTSDVCLFNLVYGDPIL